MTFELDTFDLLARACFAVALVLDWLIAELFR